MNLEYNMVLELLNALRFCLGVGFMWSLMNQFTDAKDRSYKNPFIQAIIALTVCEIGNIIIASTIWTARFGSAHGLDWMVQHTKAYGTIMLTFGTVFLVVGYCCKIRVFAKPSDGLRHMIVTLVVAILFLIVTNILWPIKS